MLTVTYWGASRACGWGQILVPHAWRPMIRDGAGRCNGWTTRYGATS